MNENEALIIVDIQNDFLPGGALAVKDGDAIIPIVNQIAKSFKHVFATQDWHPADHGSFASNHPGKQIAEFIDLYGVKQILWPDHCVQGTKGAEFSQELQSQYIQKVFQKGTNLKVDSYSGFYDNNKVESTGLLDHLKTLKIDNVYIVGLAADYCVKFTVLDALDAGLKTYLFTDATKGVNLSANDTELAFAEMESKGAILINSKEWLGSKK
ncbi:bifunctional nicotinamidase/pyrazinamidase [Peijinzhouia sedimentorum]